MKNRAILRIRVAGAAMALLACGLLAGCIYTQMQSSLKEPGYSGPAFRQVLVIGMARRGDIRRIYEDAFVTQLAARGVQAVPSYTVLPDAQLTDKEAIGQAVARFGADAVLVTRLVKLEKQDVVMPPSPRMQEYVDTAWPGTYTPEVAGQTDIATLETKLFEAGSGRLAWSGTTRAFDAQDLQRATTDVSGAIVKELARQGLI